MKKIRRLFNREVEIGNKIIIRPFPFFWSVIILITLFLIPFAFIKLDMDFSRIDFDWVGAILKELLNFNTEPEIVEAVIRVMLDTIRMALVGTLIGIAIALPLSLLASNNINKNYWLNSAAKAFLSFFRTFPTYIYAIIIIAMFGSAHFSGTMAIAIFTMGIYSKMTYERIETVDGGPLEAIAAAGGDKVDEFTNGAVPQILPRMISNAMYMFEINIRYSAVLGYVGAGGIGALLKIHGDQMNMDIIGLIILSFLVIIILFEIISWAINKYVLEKEHGRIEAKTAMKAYDKKPKQWITNAVALAVIFILIIWSYSGLVFADFTTQNIDYGIGRLKSLFSPEWSQFSVDSKANIKYLIMEVVYIAFLGTIIGSIIAVPLAFLSSKKITGKFYLIGRGVLALTRAVPSLIYAIVLSVIFGPGTLVGVVAIGITSIGMVGRLIAERLDDIDNGVIEALDSIGANEFQKFRYGVFPQVLSDIVSTIIYRFEINTRNASILGIVGAGWFGFYFSEWYKSGYYGKLGALLLALLVVVVIIEQISTFLRGRLADGAGVKSGKLTKMLRKIFPFATMKSKVIEKRVFDILNDYSTEMILVGSQAYRLALPGSDIDVAVSTKDAKKLEVLIKSNFEFISKRTEKGIEIIQFTYSGSIYEVGMADDELETRSVVIDHKDLLSRYKDLSKDDRLLVLEKRNSGMKSKEAILAISK